MLRQTSKAVLEAKLSRAILSYAQRFPSGKRALNALSGHRGIFPSFEEGWAAARRTGLPGHDDWPEIAIHLRLSESLRPSDYAALFWLYYLSERGVKVFDYGGNVGNLFYTYRRYLELLGPLDWTVLDLPFVLQEGRRIAHERNATELRFTESAAGFAVDHVLLVSGFLHYWEGTIAAFVRQFPVSPTHILINRSPIIENQEAFIAVQSTGTCAFPYLVRNATSMIADFAALGYELVDRWIAPELHVYLPFFPNQSIPHYSGFYFHLQR